MTANKTDPSPIQPIRHVLMVADRVDAHPWEHALDDMWEIRRVGTGQALQVARQERFISVAVLDGSIDPSIRDPLVGSLRTLEPNLPIVVADVPGSEPDGRPSLRPSGVPKISATGSAVHRSLAEKALPSAYSEATAGALVESLRHGLEVGFHSPVVDTSLHFKSNRSALAAVNTLITFSGPGISGGFMVSGEYPDLRAIYRRVLPKEFPSLTSLHDLAGEIASQVFSRLRNAHTDSRFDFVTVAPVFMRGSDANLREIRGLSSLVAVAAIDGGKIFFQLHLSEGESPLPIADVAPPLNEGEIQFLTELDD